MSDEIFEGTFATPSLGQTRAPIKIAGAGRLVVSSVGLRAIGFAPGSAWPAVAAALVTLGAALGGAWLVMHFVFHAGLSAGALGGCVAASAVGAASMPRKASTTPVELSFPWASVAKVSLDPRVRGVVQVVIKRHTPKGTLHFQPADAQALVTRLEVGRVGAHGMTRGPAGTRPANGAGPCARG